MTLQAAPRGRFITLEGADGAGKSTQTRLLRNALRDAGHEVVLTREPGGTPGAEAVRGLLLGDAVARWDPLAEALLHFAARREHIEGLIRPALHRGAWVICDRFVDSTMAYQGYAMGLGRTAVEALTELVAGDLMPDVTLILDLPAQLARRRSESRAGATTRYERMGADFEAALVDAFRDIAARDPARCVVIDAAQAVDRVAADIRAAVAARFPEVARA